MRHILINLVLLTLVSAVHAQTDSSQFYLSKGLEEKQKGRRQESLRLFEKGYGYNKSNHALISEMAAAYLDLRRYGQAKDKFLQLEQMGDHTDSTYRQLMNISFNMRQFDDAIKYASLLKKVRPAEQTAYILGKSYYGKDELGDAIKYLNIAAKENPSNPDIPYTIAHAYSDMQNYKQSTDYFQKALQLKPDESRWIYEMALMYYAIPDEQNALKYMIEAGNKGYKKDNEYMHNLAIAYADAGKSSEGIAIFKDMLTKRPTDVNIITALAEAYYDSKNYDEAINYYDKLMSIDAKNASALYMMGMSYQKKGDKQKGMALCDKAIQMDPSLQNLKKENKQADF